jgi:very-short-patch-repair endonuclease
MVEDEHHHPSAPRRKLIAARAADQQSLITHAELSAVGLSDVNIHYKVRSGELVRLYRGVYAMAGVELSYEQQVLAACLATGGAASHRCAARLYGLRGFDEEDRVEITVSGWRATKLRGVVAHESGLLETTRIRGIPVAAADQVLLGLADVAPRRAEAALNSALVKRLTALPRLVRFAAGGRRGRGGLVVLRGLIEEQLRAGGPTESWLEDQVVEFLRQRGFPPPVRQYRVGRWRLDLAWPERMVNFEADGRLWHTSPSDRRRDAARDAALGGIGFRTERIGWLELNEDPDGLEARLWRCYGDVKAAA